MSFIDKMPAFQAISEKEMTLADIAKCKCLGTFATRIINQIKTVWKTGHFVTDKAIADFVKNHFDNLNDITNEFKNLSVDPSRKNDQYIALKLSKVLVKASQTENLNDFESDMRISRVVFKALKILDRHEPVELIRAYVLEKKEGNDLKHQFSEFVRDREIADEEELKAVFQEFKCEVIHKAYDGDEEAIAKMRSYPKDQSLKVTAYDPEEFNRVQGMSIPDLIKALSLEVEVDEPQDDTKIDKINAKGLKAMGRYDPVDLLKAAVYDKMKDKPLKDDLKSHFATYIIGKGIKDEGGVLEAYAQYQNEMVEAVRRGDFSAKEKMRNYRKDNSLEKFTSKYEKFKSQAAKRDESEGSGFEDVELPEYSSLISEVKDMGVEELIVNLSWGTTWVL